MYLTGLTQPSIISPNTRSEKNTYFSNHSSLVQKNYAPSTQFGFIPMGPQFDALVKKGLLILGAVAAGSAAIGGGLVYWATQGNHDHPKENPTVQTPTKTDTSKK
jgi:hypothetical protein